MSKRPCSIEGCKTQISGHNRSGICVRHKHEALLAKRHKCEDCGALLSASATGYVCRDCICARSRAKIRYCSQCDTLIEHANKSGLCLRHYNEKRGIRYREQHKVNVKPYNVRHLIKAAVLLTGISEADICGPRRFKPLCNARMAIIYAAKPYHSAPTIGRLLGGRDHSSIFNALERAEALKDNWRFKMMQERLTREASAINEIERKRFASIVEGVAA